MKSQEKQFRNFYKKSELFLFPIIGINGDILVKGGGSDDDERQSNEIIKGFKGEFCD